MRKESLPILEPCEVDWSRMDGDGARRFCLRCKEHVHDISQMEESEARALLARRKGICVRYQCSTEGEIVFRQRSRGLAAAAALAVGALAAGGCFMGKPAPSGGRGCVLPPTSPAAVPAQPLQQAEPEAVPTSETERPASVTK